MKDSLRKEQFYNAPINAVWEAISVAEKISTWFINADFKAEVGYDYKFTHEETVISGKVLRANPVNELVYTWTVSGTEAITTVSWRLEEKDGGTMVTLIHTGLANYPNEETAITMAGHFDKGWANCMNDLAGYLEKQSAGV